MLSIDINTSVLCFISGTLASIQKMVWGTLGSGEDLHHYGSTLRGILKASKDDNSFCHMGML